MSIAWSYKFTIHININYKFGYTTENPKFTNNHQYYAIHIIPNHSTRINPPKNVPILYQPLKNPDEPQKWTHIMIYERSYCIKTRKIVERPYQTEKFRFKMTPKITNFR